MALERRAFVVRKRAEHAVDGLYFPSLSARTIVYKGMLTSEQLREFFPDLRDARFESGLALVHSRFSTNTFPSWPLAHPYRYLAHNGEINTLGGNRNWMRAREALLETSLIDGDLAAALPDLHARGQRLSQLRRGPRAAAPRRPPPAARGADDDPRGVGEPRRRWTTTGAPSTATTRRSWSRGTARRRSASPTGRSSARCSTATASVRRATGSPTTAWSCSPARSACSTSPPSASCARGACSRAACSSSTPAKGRLVEDEEIKSELAAEHPYGEWLAADQIRLDELPARTMLTPQHGRASSRQQRLFGYTTEELRMILAPMAPTGAEPLGSMGSDTSIAVLSDRSRLLYDYFTQLFAQVTNPPLDAIREELVTSLAATIGPGGEPAGARQGSCRQILLPLPVIDRDDLAKLMYVDEHGETPGFKAFAIDGLFDVREAGWPVRRPPRAARRSAAPSRRCANGRRRPSPKGRTSSSSPTATRRRTGAHPVAAADRGRAPPPRAGEDPHQGRAWWSRPATPARCTTWRCSSATAPRP